MKISKQAKRDAKQLFRSCVVGGLLDEDRVRQTLRQIVVQKPRGFMEILSHFHRLGKLDLERRAARVESATPLSTELQVRLNGELNRLYGTGLTISFVQNPALIGGLRVKIGSDVYDGSVQARLNALSESF
jgi:F-type H+-transporting ATPase subunit delta